MKKQHEPFIHDRPAHPFLAEGALFAAALIWGLSFVLLKSALSIWPAHFILAVRFTGAAVLLAAVFRKRLLTHLRLEYLWRGAVMGLFLFAAFSVQTLGLLSTDPGKNAFLTAVYCVMVPFLHWAINRARPDRYNIAAALLCVAGVGMVALRPGFGFKLLPGDALTLLGGFFFAVHLVAVATYSRGRDPFVLTILQFAATAVCCWLVWGLFEPMPAGINLQVVLEVGYLTLFATAIALLLQSVGQKHTNPAAAALILSLEAVFGTAASVLFTGEHMTSVKTAGFLLIFFAVVLSETKLRFFRRREAEPLP